MHISDHSYLPIMLDGLDLSKIDARKRIQLLFAVQWDNSNRVFVHPLLPFKLFRWEFACVNNSMGSGIYSRLCGGLAAICCNWTSNEISKSGNNILTSGHSLPAVTIMFIRHFLDHDETPMCRIRDFSRSDSGIITTFHGLSILWIRWPSVLDIQHHEHLSILAQNRCKEKTLEPFPLRRPCGSYTGSVCKELTMVSRNVCRAGQSTPTGIKKVPNIASSRRRDRSPTFIRVRMSCARTMHSLRGLPTSTLIWTKRTTWIDTLGKVGYLIGLDR